MTVGQIKDILDEYNNELPVKFQSVEHYDMYFLSDYLSDDKTYLAIDIGAEED